MVHFSAHGEGISFLFLENSAKFKALLLALTILMMNHFPTCWVCVMAGII